MSVPYSPVYHDRRGLPCVRCPKCSAVIRPHKRKDFESYDTAPYASHIEAEHPELVVDLSEPPRKGT